MSRYTLSHSAEILFITPVTLSLPPLPMIKFEESTFRIFVVPSTPSPTIIRSSLLTPSRTTFSLLMRILPLGNSV